MFCKYCGKESENEVCEECKVSHTDDTIKVETTRVENNSNTTSNSNNTNATNNTNSNQKSKIAAGLLGIFLGYFGVHNFYLGYTGKAIAQLLITILSCGMLSFVSGIWGLVEGILILTGSINTDADGNPLKD